MSKKFIHGIKGLAAFLGVSQPTAGKLKRDGVLSFFQHGSLILFEEETVLRELSTHNQKKDS